jgi:hypothetical protein
MNPNKQRIAIAEACRWTRQSDDSMWFDDPTNSFQVHEQDIPDYLNDLNAMHEAEKVLYKGIINQEYWQKGYGRFTTTLAEICVTPYSATAAQRA